MTWTEKKEIFGRDFEDEDGSVLSREDMLWSSKVTNSVRKTENGNFEIALPFKSFDIKLPNNYN